MSDYISRQAAIDAINKYGSVWMEYTEVMSVDEITDRALKAAKQSMLKILHDLPSADPWKWHRINPDAPDTFPPDWEAVLCSFSNFTIPSHGRFEDGVFYWGAIDDSFVSDDLFVDGWWELPKKPDVEE